MASFLSKSKCHEEETRGFVIISCKEMKITSIQKKPTLLWTQLGFGCFVDKICIQERQTASNCGTKPLPHNGINFEMTLWYNEEKIFCMTLMMKGVAGWRGQGRALWEVMRLFPHFLIIFKVHPSQQTKKSETKELKYQSLETKNNWLTLVAPKEFVFKRSSAHTTILLRLMNWPTQ